MKLKTLLLTALLLVLSSCAHNPHELRFSSRDISAEEKQFISAWDGSSELTARTPANWFNSCLSSVSSFFKPKSELAQSLSRPLPELTQLNPVPKTFPNGKTYIEYTANPNVMNKYPDYDVFLEETAEVIFEPTEPFGHIYLRVGKKVHSFNFIQSTSISHYSPRMKKSTNPELISSHGYVFQLGKEKIEAMKNEIEAFYRSSQSHNIPAFDAYSPLLKIVEEEGVLGGKNLRYVTDSPKYGNDQTLKGTLKEVDGKMVLDAGNGVIVPVVKKGNDYFTQSYSCSSSAGHILEKFFGIKVSQAYSAKSLAASLSKGNINEKISPIAVIKYYEE